MFRSGYVIEISQPGMNTPMYFLNLLFIEEEYQSSSDSINLEEEC